MKNTKKIQKIAIPIKNKNMCVCPVSGIHRNQARPRVADRGMALHEG